MESWEVEQLRRSVAMLPPGHSAGALTREAAQDLFREIERLRRQSRAYEHVVAELRNLLDRIDRRLDQPDGE